MIRSAGLLVWRRTPDLHVLLGHPGGPLFTRRDDGVWSIPKGEYLAGEAPLTAAYREFEEETGMPAPGGEPVSLGDVKQRSGKIVTIWAIEGDVDADALVSNLFSMIWPPHSGRLQEFPELDRAGWFDLPAARRKVSEYQQPFLDRLTALLYPRGA